MKSCTFGSKCRRLSRLLLLILVISLLLPLTACRRQERGAAQSIARYGAEGRSLALEIVQRFPFRGPGSPEESALADYLVEKLQTLGLQAEKQSFSYSFEGQTKSSFNVVAEIPGRGFKIKKIDPDDPLSQSREMQPPAQLSGRRLIYGAHYDSKYSLREAQDEDSRNMTAETDENGLPISRQELPPLAETDGIDDNAAAVATLLMTAGMLKKEAPAYDVTLVFFGASHDGFAGASAFAAQQSGERLKLTDAMVNLDTIYAGDRVYAHSGWNSIRSEGRKDYAARRKLYECTDVYYDNLLLTRNGFALYTNQAGFLREAPGIGTAVYREWSERQGDHTVFDQLGVPIVFFDSGFYDLKDTSENVKESNDPYFSPVAGMVGGSSYDSAKILLAYFVPEGMAKGGDQFGTENPAAEAESSTPSEDETDDYIRKTDRLEIRINNLAFILCELSRKGPPGTEPASR